MLNLARIKSILHAWEYILIFLSILIFLISLSLYITDSPILTRYTSARTVKRSKKDLIGRILFANGSIKYQVPGENEFKLIRENEDLYNMDILVSGPNSKAEVGLESGGSVELGPNTMIRLALKSDFAFGGINRYHHIQVVSGQVVTKAGKKKLLIATHNKTYDISPNTSTVLSIPNTPKLSNSNFAPVEIKAQPFPSVSPTPEPSPSPSPKPEPTKVMIHVSMIEPRQKEHFSLKAFPQKLEKVVQLKWQISPPLHKFVLEVFKQGATGKKLIQRQQLIDKNGITPTHEFFIATSPGTYEWNLVDLQGAPLDISQKTPRTFSIDPLFEGIKLSPIELRETSNDPTNNSQLLLKWYPYPRASSYQIWIGSSPNDKNPLIFETVSQNEYLLPKNKISAEEFFYRISTRLNNGFMAISELKKYQLNSAPPMQALPKDKSIIKKGSESGDQPILMTWQKTNSSSQFELEISTSPDFSQIYLKKSLAENYFFLPCPKPGKYWWRVQDTAKIPGSPLPRPNSFTIISQ